MRETLRRKTLETKEKNNTREMDVRLCVEEKIRVEGQQFSFSRNRGKKIFGTDDLFSYMT